MGLFSTYGEDGRLQLDSDTLMYGYVGKITGSATMLEGQDYQGEYTQFIDIPNVPAWHVCASRSLNGASIRPGNATPYRTSENPSGLQYRAGGFATSTSPGTYSVEYYLFRLYQDLPDVAGSVGVKLYNEAGVKSFDSDYWPLRIIAGVPITSLSGQYYSSGASGRTLAYMEYGTTLKQLEPPSGGGSGGVDIGNAAFNGALMVVRDAGNQSGFYTDQFGRVGAGWSYTVGDIFNGGVLVADVTNY